MQIKWKQESSSIPLTNMLYSSLAAQATEHSQKKRRLSTQEETMTSSSSCSSLTRITERLDLNAIISPVEYVVAAFGVPITKSTESDLFQHRPSEEEIEGYNLEVVMALREQDLSKLKEFHQNGQPLACCNRFGESLLHMACRRGYTEIVRFMIEEAGVSLWIHDDFGRTPLHYSCWTPEPNLELLDLLVSKAPSLLLCSDVRGHMPMNYVRKEHWDQWVTFLKERRPLLAPKVEVSMQVVA